MHVSPWNVALQTVNFVVLAWLLQRFLFKPVRAVLTRRQETVQALTREADAKKADAQRVIEEYRERSAGIAGEAERARREALDAAEREAERVGEEAARKAQTLMELARDGVERERLDALRALEERATELATEIALRLLREAVPESDAPLLWRVTASIDALDEAHKSALGRQIAAGAVDVVSSRSLDPSTRARLEGWLSSLAGARVAVSYDVDESLIAGVELRLPSGVWRAHWRASVARIRAEIGAHAAAA